MNRPISELEKQLELATRRDLPVDARRDHETAVMHETFVKFGRLVDAADAEFDPARLVGPLRRRQAATVWRKVFSVAIAASIVLAIGLLAWSFLGGKGGVNTVVEQDPNKAGSKAGLKSPRKPKSSPVTPTPRFTSSEYAWNDDWDDSMASLRTEWESTSSADWLDMRLTRATEQMRSLDWDSPATGESFQ